MSDILVEKMKKRQILDSGWSSLKTRLFNTILDMSTLLKDNDVNVEVMSDMRDKADKLINAIQDLDAAFQDVKKDLV